MRKSLGCFLAICLLLMPIEFAYAETDTVADLTLSCDKCYSIFEADEQIVYELNWNNNGNLSDKNYNVTVKDYFDNTVFSETSLIDGDVEEKSISLSDLGLGHFKMTVSVGSATEKALFSIVPTLETRRDSTESFFGFNTLITHSSRENTGENGKNISEFVHTVSLAGVPNVREMICGFEMLHYPETFPEINTTTWHSSYYNEVMEAYKNENLKVQLMFHTMYDSKYDTLNQNQWSDSNHKIPDNLLAAYSFTKQLTEKYADVIDSFELYNEPDLSGGHASTSDGADRYAAFAKAAAIGVADANPELNISLAGFSGKKPYIRQVFRNDIDDYVDALAFHQYLVHSDRNGDKLLDYPKNAATYIHEVENFGLSDKQIYFNETGLQVPLKETENYEMTDEQQKAQARFNVTSAIKGISNGETKHFMFKHGYANERGYGYGTMSQDNQPYAVYSAVSALTNSIGNGEYVGTLNNLPQDVEGYVFKDGTENIICLWSKTDNTQVSLNINKKVTYIDMMGNETEKTSADGFVNITVGQDLIYLRTAGEITDSMITPSGFAEKSNKNNSITEEQRIVLNQQFEDSAEVNVLNTGYYKLSSTENNTVFLDVFNFNTDSKTISIDAKTGGEWSVTPVSNVDNVEIPAMDKVRLEFSVTSDRESEKTIMQPLVFSGAVDGKPISCSVTYIGGNSRIEDYNLIAGFDNENMWESSGYIASGTTCEITSDINAISFDYTYSGGNDFWAAPYIALNDTSVFESASSVLFDARAILTQGSMPNNATTVPMRIYLYENSGERYVAAKNIVLSSDTSELQQFVFTENDLSLDSSVAAIDGEINWNDICGMRLGTNVTSAETFDLGIKIDIKNLGVFSSSISLQTPQVKQAEIVGNKLKVYFAGQPISVKDYIAYITVGETVYTATYDPYTNSIVGTVNPETDITDIELSYTDELGMANSVSLADISLGDNKITLVYSSASLDMKDTTLFAYDVSAIQSSDAETAFASQALTPIIALDEAKTDGKLAFTLPYDYEGKFVVKLKRKNEDFMNFLLEMTKNAEGEINCSILSVDKDSSVAQIQSNINKESLVIFATYKGNVLQDCVINKYTLKTGVQQVLSERKLSVEKGTTLSVFVWEIDEITPLSEKFSETY